MCTDVLGRNRSEGSSGWHQFLTILHPCHVWWQDIQTLYPIDRHVMQSFISHYQAFYTIPLLQSLIFQLGIQVYNKA